ncbi:protein phosphatase [Streptomyces sp. CB02009]|uniref:PP2C family protein-serine/threonine phosphatase n=1 Tax=Streptomyces sp. CB02009 TaxID=1703938 RepID=UPI00093DFD9A|nr:PP2C family protein-serine/threonine phosphatase [Streptomyces sp. CB02009]OKJ63598.1 protein phosphatase [Streptomyces sp. CB02009]
MERAVGEIGTTLDGTTTCRELAAFTARHLRATATVDLLTEPGAPPRRAARATPPEPTGRPESARSPESAELSGRPEPSEPPEPAGPKESEPEPAGRTDRSVAGSAGDPAAPDDPDAHRISVPLAVHDEEPLGTVTLSRTGGGPFSADEVALARYAARLAARHLGHARRLAAAEDAALHLQRALVAEPGRPHPNLEIAGGYLPAGPRALVGGDWFETVRLHFGRSLLVVGDVMGHGLDAAVDMNAYRTALREVAATDLPPHRVLRHLDSVVAEDGARRPATVLLVRVDPARGTATFASAGHLPPAVFGADGSADLVDLPVGPPLGTGVGGYEPTTRPLRPGDTLLLFTDGLVERRGEDIDHSLARLAALRLPPDCGPDQVVDQVLHRLGAHGAEDDVAVLAARIRARPPQ